MNNLNQRAFEGLAALILVLSGAVFLPAGTLHYWQAWIFLGVFSISSLAITLYLMKRDPRLLERRVKAGPGAEQETTQKIVQGGASLVFLGTLAFPALDHRYGWSLMAPAVVLLGDGLVALGSFVVFRVFRENTFTSATIEVAREQTVIITGPYGIVRHPMYAGALVLLAGIPLALGSYWGLLALVPMTGVIIVRLLDEERFLMQHLAGYAEYRRQVRSRLVPLVW